MTWTTKEIVKLLDRVKICLKNKLFLIIIATLYNNSKIKENSKRNQLRNINNNTKHNLMKYQGQHNSKLQLLKVQMKLLEAQETLFLLILKANELMI